MLFNSVEFAFFLLVVLLLYWLVRPSRQNMVLVVASYVFYGLWDWRFLSLLWISTLADFFIGKALGRSSEERRRKLLLMMSLSLNLGILGAFKYYGFFVDSATNLLMAIGLEAQPATLNIILPVGISFYTFQTLSYTFDIYRRRIEPTTDLSTFAIYVAYFPQLVAGPIERAQRLLPQLQRSRPPVETSLLRSGGLLILLGLFKKVAIADPVGVVVDSAFGASSESNSATLVLGIVGFGIQVYGDFSGYSDIARGTSRLFGIELMRNFEQPYLSRNISEFWRTWHISLSTWLHDYLYVPLGGNQRGAAMTYRNLLLTMVLGGLWHGAAWTYAIWGAMHGALLAIHRRFGRSATRAKPGVVGWRDAPGIIATFAAVTLLWPFFRGRSLSHAIEYLGGLVQPTSGLPDPDQSFVVLIAAALVLTIDLAQRRSGKHAIILHWDPVARGIAYATMVLLVVLWAGGEAQPFIYFQF